MFDQAEASSRQAPNRAGQDHPQELRRVRVSVILVRRYQEATASRVRRAPRALEDVKKVVTTSDNTCVSGSA